MARSHAVCGQHSVHQRGDAPIAIGGAFADQLTEPAGIRAARNCRLKGRFYVRKMSQRALI